VTIGALQAILRAMGSARKLAQREVEVYYSWLSPAVWDVLGAAFDDG
jgi:hypothetical protein